MSIDVSIGLAETSIEAIEVRPGEGVVVRINRDIYGAAAAKLESGLSAALHSSAHRIYRLCCDSAPETGGPHADGRILGAWSDCGKPEPKKGKGKGK